MSYQSLRFLIFFAGVATAYYIAPRVLRKWWLLLVSAVFYVLFTPKHILYLGGMILLTWGAGLLIEKKRSASPKVRRGLIAASLVLTFATLSLVKYGQFVAVSAPEWAKLPFNAMAASIAAPLGLSFFTFAAAGYLIDVHRGKRAAEKNLADYALFLSFFPTIMSGPVERSTGLLDQIKGMREIRLDTWHVRHGLLTMVWGLFLKTVIADRLNTVVNTVFARYSQFGGILLATGILAFGIQLYCDFGGVSAIALGMGEVLGFKLTDNFNTPYFSLSIGEFWRRWHVSLSSWFRDYLYIPLGGNRKGRLRKYINNMIVFLVSGLWHGAGWTYLVWGGLNGLFIVLGDLLKPLRDRICRLCHIDRDNPGNRFLRMAFTYGLVNFTWLFFRATSLEQCWKILRRIVTQPRPMQLYNGKLFEMGLDGADLGLVAVALLILLCASIARYRGIDWKAKLLEQGFAFRCMAYMLMTLFMALFALYGPSYSAAAFIYAGF